MAEPNRQAKRSALWTGLLITAIGAATNWLYFLNPPAQVALPWINVLLPAAGLAVVGLGLWRAFVNPQLYGGRVVGSIALVLCGLIFGGSTWGFFHARDIPSSSHAPRVGDRAPDFTLESTEGRMISLSQLLSKSPQDPAAAKAVLLIFYRGYW